ncbi:MAG: hypothetical protein DLM73_09145 [Chthoniobacterales bacterium]|nr:MAG: hypothetical protein DLM73_09145 [Chthoniobacterales bacterium]
MLAKMPSPLFSSDPASLDELRQAGAEAAHGNRRYVARNFLFDENVTAARAQSYHRFAKTVAPFSFPDWATRHDAYLRQEIRCGRGEAYRSAEILDPLDLECPETFRDESCFSDFGHADEQLVLVRCERVNDIANMIAGSTGDQDAVADDLRSLASRALPHGGADANSISQLELLFAEWHRAMDRRPSFSTFLAHLEDLIGKSPTDDATGWADEVCNRLGLVHFQRGDDFFVFGYTVGELATLQGQPDKHPLTLPTVIDQGLSYAFCPAPRGEPNGFTVHLGEMGILTPEVLHPGLRLAVRYLLRVGTVSRDVPASIELARKRHFESLRAVPNQADYAFETDPA